jgi:8-oxo-dGTP pyrophosphatase MutT (NUDIX family)
MTEAEPVAIIERTPSRIPGTRAVRPRDAATLIIVRNDRARPEVLMGKRNGGHNFMPNLWVFPGGRIDRADYRAPHATELKAEVAATFAKHKPVARGRALALTAVRETFEETGLLLARPAEPRPGAGPWREFLAQGALPDLSSIDIVFRAITPPAVGKRFDTWFLMAPAENLVSLERQPDCGELEEIAWFSLPDALDLKLPTVTRMVLQEVGHRQDDPSRPAPFARFQNGGPKMGHL